VSQKANFFQLSAKFLLAGVGLPNDKPAAHILVETRGGSSEAMMISPAGLVYSKSISVGWDDLDTAIVNYLKRAYNLTIEGYTLEEIKMRAIPAFAMGEENALNVCGRDSISNSPKTITISSQEIHELLSDMVHGIVGLLRNVMDRCPPELLAYFKGRGICLLGSGAGIKGVDQILSNATGFPVVVLQEHS